MVLSKAVFLTIKACNRFKSSGQAMVFFLVAMLGLFLCATPAFAAGGSCPNGNNTIDPQGNPISITNVGVTGAITGAISSFSTLHRLLGRTATQAQTRPTHGNMCRECQAARTPAAAIPLAPEKDSSFGAATPGPQLQT